MPRIERFVHGTGAHCGSTSLRNLSRLFDWGYGESTCFGLGSGLGFTYLELPESPHRAFFGRPLFLEEAFFDHLEIGYELRDGDDWAAVLEDFERSTRSGRPVMVFTDIYWLDYFDTDTHFAPHSLLVVGYDEQRAVVSLADSEFDAVQVLPADRLEEAMNSTHVVPLANRRLIPTGSGPSASFETAASRAIAETADYLLDPAGSSRDLGPGTHGIPGIEAFADELPSYASYSDPSWTVRFAYQNVERRGTGGGAFRRLYADFLRTVEDRVDWLPPDTPREMAAIADSWTDVGGTLKAASEVDGDDEMASLLADASERIRTLADRERTMFERLQDHLAAAGP